MVKGRIRNEAKRKSLKEGISERKEEGSLGGGKESEESNFKR